MGLAASQINVPSKAGVGIQETFHEQNCKALLCPRSHLHYLTKSRLIFQASSLQRKEKVFSSRCKTKIYSQMLFLMEEKRTKYISEASFRRESAIHVFGDCNYLLHFGRVPLTSSVGLCRGSLSGGLQTGRSRSGLRCCASGCPAAASCGRLNPCGHPNLVGGSSPSSRRSSVCWGVRTCPECFKQNVTP